MTSKEPKRCKKARKNLEGEKLDAVMGRGCSGSDPLTENSLGQNKALGCGLTVQILWGPTSGEVWQV